MSHVVLQMKDAKMPTIFNDKSLKKEFKIALRSASNSKALMPIQASEIEKFFNEKEYQAIKIKYSDAALRDVKLIIKAKVKNRSKVLAILKGNDSTTLDHLISIWTSILKKVRVTSWGYYLNGKASNSLYLFVK